MPRTPAAPRPIGPGLVLGEADDHAGLGGDHDLALAVGAQGLDDLVALVEADGLDAAGPGMRVGLQLRLLHLALAGDEEDVAARGEVAHGHAGGHPLALAQGQEIDHGLALGLAPALGHLVHLEPVHLAEVGEEQQRRVGGGHEEVLDDVLFLGLHARHALAAAPLAPVGLHVGALDVARTG